MILRPYQETLKSDVYQAWNQGAQNVLMRLDTGGGKGEIIGVIELEIPEPSCIIAHRQELVGDLSKRLARNGIPHDIIGSRETIRGAVAEHMAQFGRSFYMPGSPRKVASIDTLVGRDDLGGWAPQVKRWTVDEGHHVVENNKWHTALETFTHRDVRGLLPTATPLRADGKGLGRRALGGSGVADIMVEGPPMRWLIDQGFLTPYRIVCPTSDMQVLGDVPASGDWSPAQLKDAAKRSHIVGDVVAHYLQWAKGKTGITFTTDVDTANAMAAAYRAAGVRAEAVTSKTEAGYRRQIFKRLEAREIEMIVAVDVVSEGTDIPALEVGIFARPTASLATYRQQFGRLLRLMAGKLHALVIDCVGNFLRHGPPDRPRDWPLHNRDRRSRSINDSIPSRVCLNTICMQPYERIHAECPHCGTPAPEPAGRSSPAQVDGDLGELDLETLERLRGAVATVDMDAGDYARWLASKHVPQKGVQGHTNRLLEQQAAQAVLRDAMAHYGGPFHAAGEDDRTIQRRFWFQFGLSTLEACALSTADAEALTDRIRKSL